MDTSWYRRFFADVPPSNLQATRALAEKGDAEAQFALGLKYGNSLGASQDFGQAVQWYRKAAVQNHALAQFNLGIMYARGQGVSQDDVQAILWIRRAADQGDAGAQFNLGMRLHRACVTGPSRDAAESRIEAYKWLWLSAAQGYKDSDAACERVTLDMTREQVTEGNRRAAAFGAVKPAEPSGQ